MEQEHKRDVVSIRRLYTTAEYHQVVASLMKEKEWMQQVIDIAKLQGWKVYHTFNSQRSEPGYPDLHCIRPPRSLYAELKAERGKLTKEQKHWLDMLSACGYEVYTWKPSQWDEVVKILQK